MADAPPPAPDDLEETPSSRRFALGCVLLVALGLRLWGLCADLPCLFHPDEPGYVQTIIAMIRAGEPNPHVFNYGSLFFYIHVLAYLPFYLLCRLTGALTSTDDLILPLRLGVGVAATPMYSTFVLGRAVTVAFALGSVALLGSIARRLLLPELAVMLAAMMLAVSPSNVAQSHFVIPNCLVVFFVLLSFRASIAVFQGERTRRNSLLAGAAAGLAAACKYNGGLIVVALVAGHLLGRPSRERRFSDVNLGLLAAAGAFVVAMPYAILDHAQFMTHLVEESLHYRSGHAGMEGDTSLWYLTYLVTHEGPLVVVAVLALLHGLSTRRRETLFVASFPLLYLAFISRFAVRNEGTLMPMLPFLHLFAARGLLEICGLAFPATTGDSAPIRGVPTVAALRAMTVLAAMMVVVPVARSALEDMARLQLDSRKTAIPWIQANLPPGSRISLESYGPFVDPGRYEVMPVGELIDHDAAWYRKSKVHYLVFSQGMYARFFLDPERYGSEIQRYNELWSAFPVVKAFHDGGMEIRIHRVPETPPAKAP